MLSFKSKTRLRIILKTCGSSHHAKGHHRPVGRCDGSFRGTHTDRTRKSRRAKFKKGQVADGEPCTFCMFMLCDAELKMRGAFIALAYLRACLVTSACSWIGNVENSSYLRPTSKAAAPLLKPRACRCSHRVKKRISKRAAKSPLRGREEKMKKKEVLDAGHVLPMMTATLAAAFHLQQQEYLLVGNRTLSVSNYTC